MAKDLQHSFLANRRQVVTLDQRWASKPRMTSFRRSWIDEHGRRLTYVIQIARDHGKDRVQKSSVLCVALYHQGRADFLSRFVLKGKGNDHNIAAIHADFP